MRGLPVRKHQILSVTHSHSCRVEGETMDTHKLRIRIIFGNGVLTNFQKKDGLKRSWLLLKPIHQTISDVVLYILHSFQLYDSCPNGISLSMEGFVLPEFESTSIFKDKDLISVKRKVGRLIGEIVEKQPILTRFSLLENKEFHEEGGSYQCNADEDIDETEKSSSPLQNFRNGNLASKKRKSSSKLETSKKKRKREGVVNTAQKKHLHDCEQITIPQKKRKHENKRIQNALFSPGVTEKCANDLEPEYNFKSELDETKEDSIPASCMSDRVKKVSRNTLRKRSQKAIKRLHQDKTNKMEKYCDKQKPAKNMTTDTESRKDIVVNIEQQCDEDSDAVDDDLVPVVIRPGRIRFTPSRKVKDVQEANNLDVPSTQNGNWEEHLSPEDASDAKRNQMTKEAYCWNGITNKRKGQKWGREKQSTSAWEESGNYNTHSSSTWAGRNQASSSWQESKDINGQSSNTWASKNHPPKKTSVDFNKLLPLIDLPKVGDIIAYRLLELSSSWCPELSSFRIGKITSFEPETNKVILVPVPEYPLNLKKKANGDDNADKQTLGFSVYNEDGSLETDFPSLNDVRILKLGHSTLLEGAEIPTTTASSVTQILKSGNEAQDATTKKVASEISNQEPHTPANGKKDVWEEISEAVSAKKAQLLQEDNWNKKKSPAKRSWSYRSSRRSAMGPSMGRLREQNGV